MHRIYVEVRQPLLGKSVFGEGLGVVPQVRHQHHMLVPLNERQQEANPPCCSAASCKIVLCLTGSLRKLGSQNNHNFQPVKRRSNMPTGQNAVCPVKRQNFSKFLLTSTSHQLPRPAGTKPSLDPASQRSRHRAPPGSAVTPPPATHCPLRPLRLVFLLAAEGLWQLSGHGAVRARRAGALFRTAGRR